MVREIKGQIQLSEKSQSNFSSLSYSCHQHHLDYRCWLTGGGYLPVPGSVPWSLQAFLVQWVQPHFKLMSEDQRRKGDSARMKVKVIQLCLTLCNHGSFNVFWTVYNPWSSPGQNTGVGSLSLLQGIFPTQVSCIVGVFFIRWATREAPRIHRQ